MPAGGRTERRQVDRILREQFDRAMSILAGHRDTCMKLVAELVERLELTGKEIMEAIADGKKPPDIRKAAAG